MKFTDGELREIAARTYWVWARENPAEAQARLQGRPWPPATADAKSPKRPGRRQSTKRATKPSPGSMADLRERKRRGTAAAAARRRARYHRNVPSWRRR